MAIYDVNITMTDAPLEASGNVINFSLEAMNFARALPPLDI